MRKLRIHDAATLEASEAAIWYERERTGLGAEFEQAIDRALDVLEQDVVPLATMPGAKTRALSAVLQPEGDDRHGRVQMRSEQLC